MGNCVRFPALFVAFLLCSVTAPIEGAAESPADGRYRGPIIDMHMHARPRLLRTPTGTPLPRPCNPKPCDSIPARYGSANEVLEATLDAMEKHRIVLGFLSTGSIGGLESTYAWQAAAPERFLASPFIGHPDDVDLAALRAEYESGRLQGMGELGIQYEGVAISDPRVRPLLSLAMEFDVPVLVHHHGTGAPNPAFRVSLGHPEQLEEIVNEYAELRIFVEAAGFPYLEEMISMMYRYPNIYADLSLWKYPKHTQRAYLRDLAEAGLTKRLMFGSDQVQWPEVIDELIQLINDSEFLTKEQKYDIFYRNAARFLRLSDDQIALHHEMR